MVATAQEATFNPEFPLSELSMRGEMIPVMTPRESREEFPLTPEARECVIRGRTEAQNILNGRDNRLLIIVGPCSIHDPVATLEYAGALVDLQELVKKEASLQVRFYPQKPRSTVGWTGFVNDVSLGVGDIVDPNLAIRFTRKLALDVNNMGIACATEALDLYPFLHYDDLMSYVAIGARTVESPGSRQLGSYLGYVDKYGRDLSTPVGMKNTTRGDIGPAINAVIAANASHRMHTIDDDGRAVVVTTLGNPLSHLILRGGDDGPNCTAKDIQQAGNTLLTKGLLHAVVVDASHGNSNKNHIQQLQVLDDLADLIANGTPAGEGLTAEDYLRGIMIEGNLVAGHQPAPRTAEERDNLVYGLSITDDCISLAQMIDKVTKLAEANRFRMQRMQRM
jgi:3-deoxy-7-phosphoheptulonate synthase